MEQVALVVGHHRDLLGQGDLDRALAGLLQHIGVGLQFVAAGLNLTNEVFGFYNGSSIYPIQREYYKTSYMFGLRYTLSNEPR